MFGAIGLRRFRQDHRAAVPHQQIARRTERGIGGHAGIAVRAAALQRHRQFARRHRFATHLVRLGQHLLHERDAGFHRLARAAHRLDVHVADAVRQPLLLHQAADLVHLAAQPQHDDMREIGVPRVAGQRAAQHAQRLALGHAAAGLVRQRHHAIDIRELRQRIVAGERIAAEHIGDQPGDMRRAVHRRQDADVVARRHAAVRSADAVERRRRVGVVGRLRIDAVGVVLGEVAHLAVLHVHVLAGRDRARGEADDLAIAAHRLARPRSAAPRPCGRRECAPPPPRQSATGVPGSSVARAITTPSSGCRRITGGGAMSVS